MSAPKFCEFSNALSRWTDVDGIADDIDGRCDNGATWVVGDYAAALHVCFRHIGHAAAVLKHEGHSTITVDYADPET